MIEEVIIDGEKHYSYTSKADYDRGIRKNQMPQLQRMAAYCRVSTDNEEQLLSYENQVRYYTEYINNSPLYTMAGIYAD